jgi:glycosyl transferase family 87
MTWWTTPRPADPDSSADEGPRPWRAGAAFTPPAEAQRVVLDGWDDELTKDDLKPKPTQDEYERRWKRRAAQLRIANLVLFALAVVGAAAGVAVAWMHVVSDPLADARAYFDAATRLNHGDALYPAGLDPNHNQIYLYPPLLAQLLRPLALLGYGPFSLIWELIVIATFVWLLQHLGVRKRSTWIAIGLLGVPIGWALTIAQAHIPMTLLMALGQPWSIAIAANLKLFPVLIALYWLGKRDWEALLAFLVWTVLIVAAQLIVDVDNTLAFVKAVGFDQTGEPGVLRNFSIYTISPLAWLAALFVGCLVILAAARTRWGWAVAVTVATLAPPRLLVYMLTSLLAGVRKPREAGEPDPEAGIDVTSAYVRSFR